MPLTKKYILALIIIFVAVLVGYKLRATRFSQVPFPGESLDEYSNAWVGLSLIRIGTPVGMSGLAGYPSYDTRYINVDRVYQGTAKGSAMQINKPWFDHPPMMGLIMGGYSYLKGARVFEDTTATLVRKPIIWISTISIALGAVLAWLVLGPEVAVATAIITATSPLMLINGRAGQAESGMVPLFLLSVIFLWLYKKYQNRNLLIASAVVVGVALLFKLSAIALVIGGVALLMIDTQKSLSTRIQECLIFGAISMSFLGLFLIYGMALDPKTFIDVFLSNSNRVYGIGLNAITELMTTGKVIGGKSLSDSWPLVGWLGLAYLLGSDQKNKKEIFIWVPIFSYLAVYLFFGSESYGWYRIPFMPFIVIIAAWLCTLFIKNLKLTVLSALAMLIPIGMNLGKLLEIQKVGWVITSWRLGAFLTILGGISLLFTQTENKKIKWLLYLVMFLLFALSIYTNLLRDSMFTVDYWYKVN